VNATDGGWQEQAIANDVLTAAELSSLAPAVMVHVPEALFP